MSEEKKIDRLFQERFKDFEAAPSDRVWTDIQASLDKMEPKRRIIPLWWRLGGIAAAFALLLTLGYNVFYQSDADNSIPAVTNSNTTTEEKTTPAIDISADDAIVIAKKEIDTESASEEEEKLNSSTTSKTQLAPSPKKEAATIEMIASEQKDHQKQPGILKKNVENAVAKTNKVAKDPSVEKNNVRPSLVLPNITENEDTRIAKNNKDLSTPVNNEKIVPITNTESNGVPPSSNKQFQPIDKELKEASSAAVAEAEIEQEKQSLLEVAAQKELEEATEIADNGNLNKWSVNPTVAPVYYNTFGEGSPIHSQFKDNDKNGELNLSYGVHVAYAVSPKISVRSGINNVTVGYGTNDVAFTPSVQATGIGTINYRGGTPTMNVADTETNDTASLQEASGFENRQLVGTMNQKLSYLEVPLEIKYKVIDNKLGLNLIAGASSLFLTDNSISVSSEAFASEIGEANNLNKVSFSTNIGLGIDYKLNDKFQVNLEPMFKYQVNTFSDNEGNFKPYILGVYTGVSYQF